MDTYITVRQLSERTGYKESYIRKMCENGLLPHSKPTGRKIFFNEREIAELFSRTRRTPLYETYKRNQNE